MVTSRTACLGHSAAAHMQTGVLIRTDGRSVGRRMVVARSNIYCCRIEGESKL